MFVAEDGLNKYTDIGIVGEFKGEVIHMPHISFEPLYDTSKVSFLQKIMENPTANCFLVYLRYKYSHEINWEYSTECCALCNYRDILWFSDWYEGQQDVEYLAVAVIE